REYTNIYYVLCITTLSHLHTYTHTLSHLHTLFHSHITPLTLLTSFFFFFFSFQLSLQGSPHLICLHLTLSSASSSLTPTNFMSSFTTSINLLFGLPLGLLPGSSNLSILLPICSLSLLCTCPNHLSLASLTLSPKHLTCAVPLMYSFLILSILVTPKENLSILVSATSSSASCLFLSATVSKPYNIAGLTTVLYTFPFILAETYIILHIIIFYTY
ncbi:hypothetical protein LDENG_00159280, partial [Lucifuga dentata]